MRGVGMRGLRVCILPGLDQGEMVGAADALQNVKEGVTVLAPACLAVRYE